MKIRVARGIGFCVFIGLFASCASSYTLTHPTIVNYSNESVVDSVSFSYKYDILSDNGNRKYARKERKEGIKVLAIKIVNNSTSTLNFKDNSQLYSGEKPLILLDNKEVYSKLKQSVPSYIIYLILLPIHKFSVNLNGPANIFPFGYILGPLFAGSNMIIAAHANANFVYEMVKYDIAKRPISPGEIVYGIIAIDSEQNIPLTLKIKK